MISLATLLIAASTAHASTGYELVDPVIITVDEGANSVIVFVHQSGPTVIHFTSPIQATDHVTWPDFTFREEPGVIIILHPGKHKKGRWGTIRVGTRHYDVTLIVFGTDDPTKALHAAKVVHRTEAERYQAAIDARAMELAAAGIAAAKEQCSQENDELRTQYDVRLTEHEREIAQLEGRAVAIDAGSGERQVLTEVLKAGSDVPLRQVADEGRGVAVRGQAWQVVGRLHILVLVIKNYDSHSFDIGQLQVFDGSRRRGQDS